MSQLRYIISDASRKIDVEPHVLRYWEEELGIKVPRNEMGHRYYREQDIELFKGIKKLKEKGFQLRAIKMILPDISKIGQLDKKSILMLKDELNTQVLTMDQVASEREIKKEDITEKPDTFIAKKMNKSVSEVCAAQSNTVQIKHDENKVAQFKIIMSKVIMDALRENNKEFSKVMSTAVSDNVLKEVDYMMRMKEEREEERLKKLDDSIRLKQKSKRASGEEKKKRKGLFRRN